MNPKKGDNTIKSVYKKPIIGTIIFIVTWWLATLLGFIGTITVTFILNEYLGVNLEMGWMAVILILPPVIGSTLSLPSTYFIMKKWVDQ